MSLLLALAKVREVLEGDAGQGGPGGSDGSSMPSYAPGVSVTSSSAKLLAKLARKEQRKGAVRQGVVTGTGADASQSAWNLSRCASRLPFKW